MKTFAFTTFVAVGFVATMGSMGFFKDLKSSIEKTHQYEKVSLAMSKENRALKKEITELKFEMEKLRTKNNFLSLKLEDKMPKRAIASVPKPEHQDLVAYDVYKWGADKLLAIGDKEFHFRHYDKSAQFFNELIQRFPKHASVNDRVLFAAGIAAYESKKHYKWSSHHLKRLVESYPKSKYYRGAKLWLALSELKQGNKDYFVSTVEEFREKYRNTDEWKILSKHYETFTTKLNP
jgi:tetratricopeptide (TPR) repeat protein